MPVSVSCVDAGDAVLVYSNSKIRIIFVIVVAFGAHSDLQRYSCSPCLRSSTYSSWMVGKPSLIDKVRFARYTLTIEKRGFPGADLWPRIVF
jgi:hypothetical protein